MPLLSQEHDVVHDIYHGVRVPDPFRWLEDRSLPETETWISQQEQHAAAYFHGFRGFEGIRRELGRRLDVDVCGDPTKVAGRYFCRIRRQGQEQACLCTRFENDGSWQTLVDPSSFGPATSVDLYRIPSDGSTLAYLKRSGGSDQAEVGFIQVDTGAFRPLTLKRGYARGLIVHPGLEGCIYCHELPEAQGAHQIRFANFAGTIDKVLFELPRHPGSKLTLIGSEERFGSLYAYEEAGEQRADLWLSTTVSSDSWAKVLDGLPSTSTPFLCGEHVFLLSLSHANTFSISELDCQGNEIRRVVTGAKGDVRGIASTATHLYVALQHGLYTEIRYWGRGDNAEGRLNSNGGETIRLCSSSPGGDAAFFTLESYSQAPTIFEHNACSGESLCFHAHETNASSRIVEMRAFPARDSEAVPVTLMGCDDTLLRKPVVVLVYGSFGSTLLPQFSNLFNLLVEAGAVLAVLHIRGGGEKGKRWHDSGRARNKPISISDVIDGIAWLSQQPFVDPGRIALYGVSAGGLLVASVAMKIPEQLRSVVCVGPLLDMLRYDKYGLARRWRGEFGTSDSRDDFDVLFGYSPYHNVSPSSQYPAFLFVTGDEDDRCNPAHVRKMAARLNEACGDDHPVIVDYSAVRGHTPGLPHTERLATLSRRYTFLAKELDLNVEVVRCA